MDHFFFYGEQTTRTTSINAYDNDADLFFRCDTVPISDYTKRLSGGVLLIVAVAIEFLSISSAAVDDIAFRLSVMVGSWFSPPLPLLQHRYPSSSWSSSSSSNRKRLQRKRISHTPIGGGCGERKRRRTEMTRSSQRES